MKELISSVNITNNTTQKDYKDFLPDLNQYTLTDSEHSFISLYDIYSKNMNSSAPLYSSNSNFENQFTYYSDYEDIYTSSLDSIESKKCCSYDKGNNIPFLSDEYCSYQQTVSNNYLTKSQTQNVSHPEIKKSEPSEDIPRFEESILEEDSETAYHQLESCDDDISSQLEEDDELLDLTLVKIMKEKLLQTEKCQDCRKTYNREALVVYCDKPICLKCLLKISRDEWSKVRDREWKKTEHKFTRKCPHCNAKRSFYRFQLNVTTMSYQYCSYCKIKKAWRYITEKKNIKRKRF